MRSPRRLVAATGLLSVGSLVVAVGLAPLGVSAADHLDAPAAKADHRVDITDIYAYRQAGGTTLILNVDGLMTPTDSKTAAFRSRALYEIKVDTNLDGKADIAYRVRFSGPRTTSTGSVVQDIAVRRATGAAANRNEWSGTLVALGKTTPYHSSITRVAPVLGGGKLFAGARDDPFFFDLTGFVTFKTQLLMGSTNLSTLLGGFTGTDTFAGTNVLSIALNVPNSKLGGTGKTVGIWGTTSVPGTTAGSWKQIDRMGRPAINTVFNGLGLPLTSAADGAEKDAFNFARPNTDRSTTKDNVVTVLNAIGNVLTANGATAYTAAQVNAIANVLLPDELTYKVGDSAGFLNGRKPWNDVIDAEFSLLTNGAVTSDGVNANDTSFLPSFPTLAKPH